MKCLTMQIDRQLISGLGMTPGMLYVKDHCPKRSVNGITVHAEVRALYLDATMKVNITSELLRIGLGNGDVKFEGNRITILRASVRLGRDGYFELIPETPNDKDGAICLFDLGAGGYSTVEYAAEKFELIARGMTDCVPFVGYASVALVAMQPGSYLQAQRYSKRWLVFGENVLRETLSYFFDGNELSLQNPPASR